MDLALLITMAMDEVQVASKLENWLIKLDGKEPTTVEENSEKEPYVGMGFESEEAAKVFYDAYATSLGFVMRIDAFRRSMRDGQVLWRRLVCNKESFQRFRAKRTENRES
ncbi:hypothetical protein Nepgr_004276 [Nepenthes gracilis]|uniref:FAR1 domain-containing protein n=1 Tax=Nepenthes gracilis TaxID=150966 RepID=A0AAD3S173_NEPGR|nr:hypothetical protein Nepgr_004276 [Nepenthes gracilis]